LRKEIIEDSPHKTIIQSYINKGQLVPNRVALELIKKSIQQKGHIPLLFDGFPRNIQQAMFLDELLLEQNKQIDAAIFLDVPKQNLIKRLKDRASKEGRIDDQDENTVQARMAIYEQETLPIIDYYQIKNKLYKVNGTGDTDEITKTIEVIINSLLHE